MAGNGHALPKCRKSVILQLGGSVTFIFYAALIKLNRNTKAEIICFIAGILAMLCWLLLFFLWMNYYLRNKINSTAVCRNDINPGDVPGFIFSLFIIGGKHL